MHAYPAPVHPAEILAFSMLQERALVRSKIVEMVDLLPFEPSPRAETGRAFAAGAYGQGALVGFRKNTLVFPFCVFALTAWLRLLCPDSIFSAIVLLDADDAPFHKDVRNHPVPNTVAPLTVFQGGLLWVEGCGSESLPCAGHTVQGGPLSWEHGAVTFDAYRLWHKVLPWTGRRLVLVGFTPASCHRLLPDDRAKLVALGFPLPPLPQTADAPEPARRSRSPAPTSAVVAGSGSRTRSPPPGLPGPLVSPTPVGTPPLFIELCAGTALLSQQAAEAGFRTLAVDHHGNRFKPHVHVLQLDLRSPSSWEFLRGVLSSQAVAHVHIAVPCGTCSRARDLSPGPPPLRDLHHVWGLPGLSPTDHARVQSANAIYEGAAAFFEFVLASFPQIGVSVENPLHSWLWMLPPFASLMQRCTFVAFDLCRHGSNRRKATGLLTNVPGLGVLSGPCPGCAEHQPWQVQNGEFATAREAAYPLLFCQRFVAAVAASASASGLGPDPDALSAHASARAANHVQPRGRRFPPLIPEYSYTVTVFSEMPPPLNAKRCLTDPWLGVPAGSRFLRQSLERGGVALPDFPGPSYVTFGVYREPLQYVHHALSLQHPFDLARAVPDDLLRVLFKTLTGGPVAVLRSRLLKLRQWRAWAKELESENAKLFASMHKDVAAVLRGKRLALLEKIGRSLGWPDEAIYQDLADGFRITGYLPATGVFEPDVRPAELDEQEFWTRAPALQNSLVEKIRKQAIADFEQPLWELTLDEADPNSKAWLHGPLSLEEVRQRFGDKWCPCRRFAVWQKKWRPIDDLSENNVNSTFGAFEKVALRALDEIVWVCSTIFRYASSRGDVSLTLSDGTCLNGKVHAMWEQGDNIRPLTKTYDLRSAYKQLPLHPEEQRKAVIMLREPGTREPRAFVCRTLPFGSAASVLQFNRVSLLLRRILLEVDVLASCYYDDYPCTAPKCLAEATDGCAHAVFTLLGFETSVDKECSFSTQTELLGVTLDTSDQGYQAVRVANKPDRASAIAESLEMVMHQGRVRVAELPALFGRLQFAESQLLGRSGRLALADLRKLEAANAVSVPLMPHHLEAFALLLRRMRSGPPRSISTAGDLSPVLVFTDGACEPKGDKFECSVGGLLIVPGSRPTMKVFGCRVPDSVVQVWAEGRKHIIGQTELYAVVLARVLWSNDLSNRRVVYFIDHSGVQGACMTGTSSDSSWRQLLMAFEVADEARPCMSWFHRVPSHSNPADPPSRGRWHDMSCFKPFVEETPRCFLTGTILERME